MNTILRTALVCAVLASAPAALQAQQTTTLRIRAAMVGQDLKVHPIPQIDVRVVGARDTVLATTNLDGEATVRVPAGAYRVESVQAVEFGERKYDWQVPVTVAAGGGYLELTQRNAAATALPAAAPPPAPERRSGRRIAEEAAVFERVKSGVLTVQGEQGKGTGFLVDANGTLLTNAHVIEGSNEVRVQLSPTVKVPARVLWVDRERDVAALAINPSRCPGCAVLPLARDEGGEVAVEGERVLAIGSPLSQTGVLTTGIVSRVEPRAILSDVNINPGNSGGPLLNLDGEVIAINTFGESARTGPGISGSIRISEAARALRAARDSAAGLQARPVSDRLLPVAPETAYPIAALRAAAAQERYDLRSFSWVADPFDVLIMTPRVAAWREGASRRALMGHRQAREARAGAAAGAGDRVDPIENWVSWDEYVGQRKAVVIFNVMPRAGETANSIWGNLFGAMLAGRNWTYRADVAFRGDFQDMRILRDGRELVPIERTRAPAVLDFESYAARGKDYARQGIYVYHPDDFAPDASGKFPQMEVEFFSLGRPRPVKVPLQAATVEKIWNDFAPYRAELSVGGADASAAELASAGRTLAGAGLAADAEPYLARALEASPYSRDALAALVPIRYERARGLHREAVSAATSGNRAALRDANARAEAAFRELEPLAARLVEVDPNNPAALDWYEEALKRSRNEAEIARVRALRSGMRAVVDSLALVTTGEPRVEGRITPRDRDAAMEIVVTFFAEDGAEVGTATATARVARGERSARFTVPVPQGARAAAGYRYRVRIDGAE